MKTTLMTRFAWLMGGLVLASATASAATLSSQTFTTDTTTSYTENEDLFVFSDVTWTISPNVTVTTAGRFFPEGATFTVAGGGSINATTGNTYAGMRIGWSGEAAFIDIIEGSTFEFTSSSAPVWVNVSGSSISLDGIGSTFIAAGTYDSGTGEFQGVGGNGAVPIIVTNGTLQVNDLGSGFTELTVVPEPGSFALIAGCLGLTWVMLRRRG
ncbi:MAG TPA: hypothetical protein VJ952_01645 [Opitutales bacterium]|nr:hypothetical protein [Opitutales bacterium]